MTLRWTYPFESPLGLLNFLAVQWTFSRLAKVVDEETDVTLGWQLLWPVIPLTGWWGNYRFIGKARHTGLSWLLG